MPLVPPTAAGAAPPEDAASVARMTAWEVDPVLGDGTSVRTIELGADDTGPLNATLVRHDAGAAAHDRALLHVHGFNDYFFHLHLADAFAARGWAV
jgi:hypothetical protein